MAPCTWSAARTTRWLHALTTPPLLTTNATRLPQEGVTPRAAERGVKMIQRSLADEGPLTGRSCASASTPRRYRPPGRRFIHLIFLATLRGLAIRGPMVGKQHAYVLVRDWLGPQKPVDRDAALAELARRYLAGHGPADDCDLARWAGLPLRDSRAGLGAIAPSWSSGDDGLVDLAKRQPAAQHPPPRLLGAFDPLLLGWSSREEVVGPHKMLVTTNGIFRPFALVDGRAVATWRYAGGKVTIEHLGEVSKKAAATLEEDLRPW